MNGQIPDPWAKPQVPIPFYCLTWPVPGGWGLTLIGT